MSDVGAERVLITGADGQLGSAIGALLPDATLLSHRLFSIEDESSFASLLDSLAPTVVINCAAFTNVDGAEVAEARATAINGHAVGASARLAAAARIRFVTFSTDYVFDGSSSTPYVESSTPHPTSAYGRSKLVGEERALQHSTSLVIRSAWLYERDSRNFVTTMIEKAANGESLRVVDDQIGSPTRAGDLAKATLEAIAAGASGLLHLAGEEPATWFELATAAVEHAGLDPSLIVPCTTVEYGAAAPRPAYSVLGSERTTALGVSQPPGWTQALRHAVAS